MADNTTQRSRNDSLKFLTNVTTMLQNISRPIYLTRFTVIVAALQQVHAVVVVVLTRVDIRMQAVYTDGIGTIQYNTIQYNRESALKN